MPLIGTAARRINFSMYQVDPLYKLKERSYFVDELDTILAARGEIASLQIVVKANEEISEMNAVVKDQNSGRYYTACRGRNWLGKVM